MENTELLPLGVEQKNDEAEHPSFDLCLGENLVSPLVAQHRQWLKSIRHETPNPTTPFNGSLWASILTMGRPHLIWRNHRHGLSFCLTVMRKKSIS